MLSDVRKAETKWVIDPASPQWGRNWKVLSPSSLQDTNTPVHWHAGSRGRPCYISLLNLLFELLCFNREEKEKALTSEGCWGPWCLHTCGTGSSCRVGCRLLSTVLASGSWKRTGDCCVWTHRPRCQSRTPEHTEKEESPYVPEAGMSVKCFCALIILPTQLFNPTLKPLKKYNKHNILHI